MKRVLKLFCVLILPFAGWSQVPSITQFLPLTATVSTGSIIITGTNFDATSNTVYIGGAKATITAQSATSITATVPAGASWGPVSVTANGTGYTAISHQTFTPKYGAGTGGSVGTNLYNSRQGYTTGNNSKPRQVIQVDLNGDGKNEVVTCNQGAGAITVFANSSTSGSFSFSSQSYLSSGAPLSITSGDFDRDGKIDIATANNDGYISVFKNTSTGTVSLANSVDILVSSSVAAPFGAGVLNLITAADYDLDGRIDLVTYSESDAALYLLPNTTTSAGTLDVNTFNLAGGYTAIEVATGLPVMTTLAGAPLGLGNDKFPEPILTSSDGSLYVYKNNSSPGSFSFATAATFSLGGTSPTGLVVGDMDGDSKLDVMTANFTTDNLSVLLNNTAGATISFAAASNISFTDPAGVVIASIDGDGIPDLIATSQTGTASVLRATTTAGSISFEAARVYPTSPNPLSVIAGDFDGDALPDMMTNTYSGAGINSKLVVYRNNSSKSIPTITSFAPVAALPSNGLALVGTNFNTTAANNVVYFGSNKNAVPSAATATNLSVLMPKYSLTAPLSLTDITSGLSARSPLNLVPKFGNGLGGVLSNASFEAKVSYGTGSSTYPNDVRLVDLDNDGISDMVSANQNGSISIIRNTNTVAGTLSFAAATNLLSNSTNATVHKVLPLDVDGDGLIDLVTINEGGSISLFKNNSSSGSISLGTAVQINVSNTVTASDNVISVASGDFNADGKPDLAMVDGSFPKIWVMYNTSVQGQLDGESYSSATEYTISSGVPLRIEARDLNLDGYDDMVVSNNGGFFTLFTNTSSTSSTGFSAGTDITTGGSNTDAIGLADMDYNGKLDVVCMNRGNKTISVHSNTTTGSSITFATKQDLSTGTVDPKAMALASIDGDQRVDIVVINASAAAIPPVNDNVVVYRNSTATSGASLTFDASVTFAINTYGLSIAVGDLDGDDKQDIAATNYNPNNNTNLITVLRNLFVSSLPINFTRIAAARKASAIQVDWLVSNEEGVATYVVERSTDGINFSSIGSQVPSGKPQYGWLDASPSSQNFYRIRAVDLDGVKKYSSVVRVSLQGGIPTISVAPNPVRNRNIGIQFTDMPRGSYKVDLYNAQGQLLISRSQAHDGANAVYNLVLPTSLKNGSFTLRVSDGVNSKVQQVVVE